MKDGKPAIFSPKLNADPLVLKELAHDRTPVFHNALTASAIEQDSRRRSRVRCLS
jgi:hypothetical protein